MAWRYHIELACLKHRVSSHPGLLADMLLVIFDVGFGPRLDGGHLYARRRSSLNGTGTMSKRTDWISLRLSWDRQRSFPGEACFSWKEQQMDDERKSSKAGERAAQGLREATAKEEAKNESKTGHDLAKGADRFEERSKSSDGKSAQEKQNG
jgi:hypothetical protein